MARHGAMHRRIWSTGSQHARTHALTRKAIRSCLYSHLTASLPSKPKHSESENLNFPGDARNALCPVCNVMCCKIVNIFSMLVVCRSFVSCVSVMGLVAWIKNDWLIDWLKCRKQKKYFKDTLHFKWWRGAEKKSVSLTHVWQQQAAPVISD